MLNLDTMARYLFELKRFFIIDWVDGIIWNYFSFVLSSHGVSRQTKHVYFNISANFLVEKTLARDDLKRKLKTPQNSIHSLLIFTRGE